MGGGGGEGAAGGGRTTEAKGCRELTQHGVLSCLAGEKRRDGNGLYNTRPKTIEN
jgi:hypothetical protein